MDAINTRRPMLQRPVVTIGLLSLMTATLAIFYRPMVLADVLNREPGAMFIVPIALALLAILGLFMLLRPDLGLLFLVATLPFFQRGRSFWDGAVPLLDGKHFPLHEIILVMMVGITFLHGLGRFWKGERWQFPWRDAILPAAWLLVGASAALIATPEGYAEAWREWRWVFVEPLIAYGLVRFWVREPHVRLNVLLAIIAAGVLVAIIGLQQHRGVDWTPLDGVGQCYSDFVVETGGTVRTSSVYCHPNNLALWLDRVWPLALVLLAAVLWERQHWVQGWWRWVLIGGLAGALLITVTGMVLTYSKGARFAGAIVLIALACLPRRPWLPVVTAVVLIGLLGYSSISGPERLQITGDSSFARLSVWRSSGQMLKDHPLTGIGLDQFFFYYSPQFHRGYIEDAVREDEKNTAHPHNIVLDVWLRVGLVGGIIFGLILIRSARRAWWIWRSTHRQRWLGLAILAAATVGLLHGFVDQGYFAADLAVLLWAFIAIIDSMTSEVFASQLDPAFTKN